MRHTKFILSNNRTSFHLWWKEDLVKHQRVSKYENDGLQNFLLHYMSLLTANFIKNSHAYARIYFIFLKNVLKQTWNAFNTKFRATWKDRKSSYQVRQVFALFAA